MRKLLDATNVDGATGDYPKGRVRDKAGATPGTIYNELLIGDIYQFFQKMITDAGITENDLPDNVSNGYQLIQAFFGTPLEFGNDGGATAFQNSYAQGSTGGKLRYALVNGGRDVRIWGSIDATSGTNQVVFLTLPVGFRPIGTDQKIFVAHANDGSRFSFAIDPTGDMVFAADTITIPRIYFDFIMNITDES